MNEFGTAKLLSEPRNYAVVHLPGRRFPGVVMQGDSLRTLVGRLADMREQLRRTSADSDDLMAELEDLHELFSEVLGHYERVCTDAGIEAPR